MDDVGSKRGLIFESPELAIDAAVSGHGAALGILPLVADDLKAGRLILMFDEKVRGPFCTWIISRCQTQRGEDFDLHAMA